MKFLQSLYFRHGLFWPDRWPPRQRILRPLLIAILLTIFTYLIFTLLTYQAQAAEREQREVLTQSYLQVVLAAMNGDARFMVGEEMFECKGGKL